MTRNSMVLFIDKPSLEEEILDCKVFLSYAREAGLKEDTLRVEGILAYLESKLKS